MPVAVLCGGTMGIDTLNKLCYTIYMKLCSSSKSTVLPDELPPKHRAVYYHCLCAHLQVIQWHTEDVDLGMADLLQNEIVTIITDQTASRSSG